MNMLNVIVNIMSARNVIIKNEWENDEPYVYIPLQWISGLHDLCKSALHSSLQFLYTTQEHRVSQHSHWGN